jgi:hypothetical protein
MNHRLDTSIAEELPSIKDETGQLTRHLCVDVEQLITDRRLSLRMTRKLIKDIDEKDRERFILQE